MKTQVLGEEEKGGESAVGRNRDRMALFKYHIRGERHYVAGIMIIRGPLINITIPHGAALGLSNR